jgi:hypothetical protein
MTSEVDDYDYIVAGGGYCRLCTRRPAVVSPMMAHSRRTLRLGGGKPGAAVIDPRYYSDRHDIDTVVAGLGSAAEIGQSTAPADWPGRT